MDKEICGYLWLIATIVGFIAIFYAWFFWFGVAEARKEYDDSALMGLGACMGSFLLPLLLGGFIGIGGIVAFFPEVGRWLYAHGEDFIYLFFRFVLCTHMYPWIR